MRVLPFLAALAVLLLLPCGPALADGNAPVGGGGSFVSCWCWER